MDNGDKKVLAESFYYKVKFLYMFFSLLVSFIFCIRKRKEKPHVYIYEYHFVKISQALCLQFS